MRFKAKINYAYLVIWSFYGACMVFLFWRTRLIDSARMLMQANQHHTSNEIIGIFTILSLPALLLFLLLAYLRSFTEYYEVQEHGLFLRQGWKGILIPYTTLDTILPLAPAFRFFPPTNRILVMPEKGKIFVVAPAEKERFLAEVSKRCPQLEQRDTEYGLSLQPAIF
jgi:hypothetical protein